MDYTKRQPQKCLQGDNGLRGKVVAGVWNIIIKEKTMLFILPQALNCPSLWPLQDVV